MSSVSVSVAAPTKLTALMPDTVHGDSVTPSSESHFSGVLNASIPADASADAIVSSKSTSKQELPAESKDADTSSSAQAETAADMLLTLQAARQMDTSLQVKQPSAPVTVSSDTAVDSAAVATDTATAATDSSQSDMLTGIQGQINVNSHADIKSTAATKMNDSIPKTSVMTGNMSSVDEQLPTATATATATATQKTTESASPTDETIKTDISTQSTKSPDLNVAKAVNNQTVNVDTVDNTAVTDEITDVATSAQQQPVSTADSTPSKNDKIQNAKPEKKTKTANTDIAQTDLSAVLINMQPVASEPITPVAVSSNTETSSNNTATAATDNDASKGKKSAGSAKSASLGNMIHDLVSTLKNDDDSSVTDDSASTAAIMAEGLAGKAEDKTADVATTASTTAELGDTKPDGQTTFELGLGKDTTAANLVQHENHGVSLTGKSELGSTGALPEQAQGLRNITEQLPSLYMKNGQIEEHELGARVMLMAGQKWQEAEIQLEPQGMGKIRVQLSIDQEQQTNVQFMVQHSQAKEALDQSLPRLREILTQNGLQPGQTQVQHQAANNSGQSWNQQMANNSAAEQQTRRESSQSGNAFSSLNDDEIAQTVTVSASEAAGIDFYA